MFIARTVFVVGAGASEEVGLPIGSELATRIATILDFRFPDGYTQKSGDRFAFEALRKYAENCKEDSEHINRLVTAGRAVRDAMPLAKSIDNFVDAHRGNKDIEICSKIAIACAILHAEEKSKLSLREDRTTGERSQDLSSLQSTWFVQLFKIMNEGIRLDEIKKIFDNVAFIVFNYDRCLEHFLYHALIGYYRISEDDAAEIMNELKIVHPYGVVGQLPWQSSIKSVPFGSKESRVELLDVAGKIKTFSEGVADHSARWNIYKRFNSIVFRSVGSGGFLGFAFHDLNMQTLDTGGNKTIKRILGTGFGESDDSMEIIDNRVRNAISWAPQVRLDNRFKCFDFFSFYSSRLRSAI